MTDRVLTAKEHAAVWRKVAEIANGRSRLLQSKATEEPDLSPSRFLSFAAWEQALISAVIADAYEAAAKEERG